MEPNKKLFFDIKTQKEATLLFNTFKSENILNYDDCEGFLEDYDYDLVMDFYGPKGFSIVVYLYNDGVEIYHTEIDYPLLNINQYLREKKLERINEI